MRLLILAHNLHAGGGRSVGVNLTAEIGRQAGVDESLVIAPLGQDYADAIDQAGSEGLQVDTRSLSKRAAFDLLRLPKMVRSFKPDWVLGLGNNPISRTSARQAVLVHNSFLAVPDLQEACAGYPRSFYVKQAVLRRRFSSLSHGVDVVFCQTEAVSSALSRSFPWLPRPVVIPNVVSAAVLDGPVGLEGTPVVESQRRSEFRLLTVSRYYPQKNLESVLDAFEQFPELMEGVSWTITIGATDSPLAADLLGRLTGTEFRGRIENVGLVEQKDLRGLYERSDAVILPSLLESFSANYPEAMIFGRPILTSDRDFAREICGDAALYFDPLDPRSIAQSVASLRSDYALRERLVRAGTERIKQFPTSWGPPAGTIVDTLVSHDSERSGES